MKLLSISVQAHVAREGFFPYLKEKLGDVPFSVDDGTLGVWGNRIAALRLCSDSKYSLIVQDDAILCTDFIRRTEDFIKKMDETFPDEVHAFQLYHGSRKNSETKEEMDAGRERGFIKKQLSWGVAIVLPTNLIEECIAFGNSLFEWQDDTKIKRFLERKNIPVIYPVPCLVDHRRKRENHSLVPGSNLDRYSPYYIERDNFGHDDLAIPKIIHQIWIGDPLKAPQTLMDTWKMEGWEYKLWTEKEIDDFGLKNRRLYDYFYNKERWHACANVVRIELLERLGGIYIDADTERVASSIDQILVWESPGKWPEHDSKDFFAVYSNMDDRIANGVIGSIPNHPIIRNYIKEMGEAKVVEPPWSTIGGTMLTKMVHLYKTERTQILKPIAFYPFDSKGIPTRSRGVTYGKHYWKAHEITSGSHRLLKKYKK